MERLVQVFDAVFLRSPSVKNGESRPPSLVTDPQLAEIHTGGDSSSVTVSEVPDRCVCSRRQRSGVKDLHSTPESIHDDEGRRRGSRKLER
jgi:hypothetical protein